MANERSLKDRFYMIVDGYYSRSEYFEAVENALNRYEDILEAVETFEPAKEAMKVIDAAIDELKKRREITDA